MEKEVYIRMADQEKHHWWFTGRRAILRSIIKQYAPKSEPMHILEAGCGTGGNHQLLSEFGEVKAFEMDDEACSKAIARGMSAQLGCLPGSIPYTDEKFDIIVLFDVIEHVQEDRESIIALSKLLNPGGRIFITVPAYPSLWSNHDVIHHHFRRYTKPSLLELFRSSNVKVIRLSYYNCFLAPIIYAKRLSRNLAHSQHSDDELIPPALLNRFLHCVFSSERFLLRHKGFPFGISLLAIIEPMEDPE